MASFNKITIVGYLGRDPESRFLPDGNAVCNFSVATTEKRKGRGGTEEATTWFRINCWGKLAEICQQYLSKGKQVYVDGRLSQAEYTDKDGNKRTTLEVRADSVNFLGSDGGEREAQPQKAAAAPAGKPKAAHEQRGYGASDPDDCPF